MTLLNGAAWVAGLEIPKDGVPSKRPSADELQAQIAEAVEVVESGK
jgi:hypothetical protein